MNKDRRSGFCRWYINSEMRPNEFQLWAEEADSTVSVTSAPMSLAELLKLADVTETDVTESVKLWEKGNPGEYAKILEAEPE